MPEARSQYDHSASFLGSLYLPKYYQTILSSSGYKEDKWAELNHVFELDKVQRTESTNMVFVVPVVPKDTVVDNCIRCEVWRQKPEGGSVSEKELAVTEENPIRYNIFL